MQEGTAVQTGTLLVRSSGFSRIFKKTWQERECVLTPREFLVCKAGSAGKSESYVMGPKPKLVVGAGDAPGFSFQLVYFDAKKGREKGASRTCVYARA